MERIIVGQYFLNFVYRIEARDDVVSNSWSILADQVLGTGVEILINDPASASLVKRFYRAEVLW